jgi:hypothetical protein
LGDVGGEVGGEDGDQAQLEGAGVEGFVVHEVDDAQGDRPHVLDGLVEVYEELPLVLKHIHDMLLPLLHSHHGSCPHLGRRPATRARN